jgi:hypothetical protein
LTIQNGIETRLNGDLVNFSVGAFMVFARIVGSKFKVLLKE